MFNPIPIFHLASPLGPIAAVEGGMDEGREGVNHSFIVDPHLFFCIVTVMTEQAAAIEAIRKRADRARIPMYKLCEAVRMSPATLTRWKKDPSLARWSSIGRLEKELDRIEGEKA